MVKAKPINSPAAKPIAREPVAPSLQEQEAGKLKQQKLDKLSSNDRARMASQAGFQRTEEQKRRKKAGTFGSSAQAPIPLPDDDVDPDAWSQEGLESAQGSLGLAGAQFEEIAEAAEEGISMAESVIGSSFLPTEEDLAEMERIAERTPPGPVPMLDEIDTNAVKLFGIEFPQETPVGHKVLAMGLVVAGEQAAVKVDKDGLDERGLADGIEKVTKKGNQAVGEAQRMNKGINRELNVYRTFVAKR